MPGCKNQELRYYYCGYRYYNPDFKIKNHQYKIVKRNENSWLVDGQYSLLDFVKYFDLNLSDEQHNKFTTVAGLIIHKTSQVPDIGDKVQIENYELEIIDKDGQRIDKILVTQL